MVREDILSYVRNELGGDPNNFCNPELDRSAITARLEVGMEQAAAPVLKNLERSRMCIRLTDGAAETARWGTVSLSGYRFPWYRAFEIDMDITLGPLTQ